MCYGPGGENPEMNNPKVQLLSTGYYYLWASDEVWAQWPAGEEGPKPEHCFHPSWSWPIIQKWIKELKMELSK